MINVDPSSDENEEDPTMNKSENTCRKLVLWVNPIFKEWSTSPRVAPKVHSDTDHLINSNEDVPSMIKQGQVPNASSSQMITSSQHWALLCHDIFDHGEVTYEEGFMEESQEKKGVYKSILQLITTWRT